MRQSREDERSATDVPPRRWPRREGRMLDGSYKQAPRARTIAVATLPEEARSSIHEGKVMHGLNPDLFGDQGTAMGEVVRLVAQLRPSQKELLLVGLRHALEAEHGALCTSPSSRPDTNL